MDRRLIINADDFGQADGINKAVRQGHTQGVLTSATIMANMPAAAQAVDIAKELPSLGVGVHLNLVEGKPLSSDSRVRPILNSQGSFRYSPGKLAIRSLLSKNIRQAIRLECQEQISWVFDHGLKPTHLDSHKHVHSFPSIFPIICELAGRFEIAAVRRTFEPSQVTGKKGPAVSSKDRRRAVIVRAMARVNCRQNADFFKNDVFIGVAHTGKIDEGFFRAVAEYCSPGRVVEVMTHPGFAAGLDPDKTRLLQQRQQELETLCSRQTRNYLEQADIKLVHYGQL